MQRVSGIEIRPLTPAHEAAYDALHRSHDASLIYGSRRYRDFLQRILPDAEERTLLAFDGEALVGALPCFLLKRTHGTVINSLPFYGSTAGVFGSTEAAKALLAAYDALAREERAVSTTLIGNPLLQDDALYTAHAGATLHDERIGQFTPLPSQNIEEEIMQACHSKTRNLIRKAQKGGFTLRHDGSIETMRVLHTLHMANLGSIGGLAKPWDVFEAIRASFVYDRDYRVYLAEKDGQVAAALLVFFFHRVAEYFTPAINDDYRSDQPLTLLIFEAMQEAARRSCAWWNWGGTWLSQESVYHFKSRFGAKDFPYRYHIREYPEHGSLRGMKKADLLNEYRYFYTLPFSALEAEAV